ncbi:dihydropteroate synthase [Thioalkalivibrio denitrificans]|uniref:Dihydropteroate synthase n=1 Tax=Thioalkalivibrio denitrificans TaxID=108003 RepID=A0A1V3NE28_9GAMM|nr:dihydropteroate synthase [Thioalkalivibrio denitrificans]OOG23337.1 dihydropteroate synthase [Thioalkalivibrio denitrificans]
MREGSVMLDCGGQSLDLSRPRVMGILNVTPDSFSDGGRHDDPGRALDHALAMVEAGAAIIDVGGESTRPGAEPVPVEEELARVVPVVESIAPRIPVPVSVDTSRPEVMIRAAAAGAGLINDVRALRLPGALEAARETGLPVCLMHMCTLDPRTMQKDPHYDDVTAEVRDFLEARVAACEAAGIDRRHLVLDPGFGFGKTLEHNLALFRGLPTLADMGPPLLVGVSRKGMIGALLGDRPVDQRVHGSVAAALLAAQRGAAILRVHDVGPTVDALGILAGLEAPTGP